MKKGIDISYHQGIINFGSVKSSGIDFVILRSSYRMMTDPHFFEYVKGCQRVGLPIFGVYHFIYALTEQKALDEAIFCVSQVEEAGLGKDVMIFADFEYDSVNKAKKAGVTLTKKECTKFTKIFCKYVESKGYKAGVYTNIDYYKNWYDKEVFEKYPMWLADYTGEPNYECLIQQYTSSGRVPGIKGNVDMNRYYGKIPRAESQPVTQAKPQNLSGKYSRQAVVDLVCSWEGKKESDGSFKSIIDIYNSYKGSFPRKTKMHYNWSWCACTWSALAIKLGYTDIMPIEISCGYLVEAAKKKGCWVENDAYVPKPGDAVLYDWDDSGRGDDNKWPDHVGTVIEVYEDEGYFVVMEGNYKNAVKKRTMSINGKFIRGFIAPKYDNDIVKPPVHESGKSVATIAKEVIAGKWGNGEARKKALEKAGYNYESVRKKVNSILNEPKKPAPARGDEQPKSKRKVTASCSAKKFDKDLAGTYETTANVYCRNDAGKNKKALCCIPKGTTVKNYGYYSIFKGVKWFYIQFTLDGTQYTGFTSSKYLKK